MTDVTCVVCDALVELPADVELGEIVDCLTCGTELEVLDGDPFAVAEAPDLEEDWGE